MIYYIKRIIIPYVEARRNKPALVIMENFKGKKNVNVNCILEN